MAVAAVAFGICVDFAPDPFPTPEALFHLVLLAGSTLLGLQLARAVREATRGRSSRAPCSPRPTTA